MASWGVTNPAEARRKGVEWPDQNGDASFDDIWGWQDVHAEWAEEIEESHPAVSALIQATRLIHSDSHAAYLSYMAVRLIELRRVLKPSGSIYLHCDDTASHYLKALMDAVFGPLWYRAGIYWKRHGGRSDSNTWGTITDSILMYASPEFKTKPLYGKPAAQRTKTDSRGEYKVNILTGAGVTGGKSGQPWGGYDPTAKGRHWAVPKAAGRGTYGDWIATQIPGFADVEDQHERLDLMDDHGFVHWSATGNPYLKIYLAADRGVRVNNIWDDLTKAAGRERTGYPTQKPVALAARIIEASSDPGDVVLDPFAGCAYVPVAAEGLGRQWIACDISVRAMTVVRRQFNKFRFSVDGAPVVVKKGEMSQAALLADADVTIRGPNGLPPRTDKDPQPVPRLDLPEPVYKGQLFSTAEMRELLLQASGWVAWCCGYAVRDHEGRIVETAANFQLDHLTPKTRGGRDSILNAAPVCQRCNLKKSGRPITLEHLRDELEAEGTLLAPRRLLPDLPEMQERAADLYAKRKREKGQ